LQLDRQKSPFRLKRCTRGQPLTCAVRHKIAHNDPPIQLRADRLTRRRSARCAQGLHKRIAPAERGLPLAQVLDREADGLPGEFTFRYCG